MSIRLSKDIGTIRAGLFERIEAVQDEYAAKGWLPARLNLNKGMVRGLIELFAWGLWQLYNFLDAIHRQAIPREASADWLDVHAAQVDLTRKETTKALGNVVFLRGDRDGNVPIPVGRIVRTKPDGRGEVFRYVTTAAAVLPEGERSVSVPVLSETYGAKANAAPGQICELVTPVEGVAGVTNGADWLTAEGADEENDAALQTRYVLAWQAQGGVTAAAYKAAALSVPGAVDAYVADQHPRGEGTVDVVVQGSAGMPTDRLLADVRAALDAAIVINHDLLVVAPTPVRVSVRLTLELLSGDADATRARAESWVKDMFSYGDTDVPRFGIGRDVVRDRLASGLVSLAGVKRIRWESPAADVPVAADALAVLDALEISAVWVDEA